MIATESGVHGNEEKLSEMNQIIERKKENGNLQGIVERGICTKSVFVGKPEVAALALHSAS